MKGWELTNLKSIVEFFNGKAIGVRDSGKYKVYGSNGVIGFSEKFKYSDSLIIGRVGAHCGSIFYEKHEYWATDNTIIAKVKEGYYIKYIFHLLNAFPLNDFAGGAAQPLLNQTILGKMVFRIPPFPIQRKIAAILSAYDDLIENNNRRIAILEKMAEELYREWFVRLRFPGHENTKIVKGVPEGWEVKKLPEIAEITYGFPFDGSRFNSTGIGMPIIRIRQIHQRQTLLMNIQMRNIL
jgi:type I restriction enzyme S subunit